MESSEYDSSAVEANVRSLWEERDVYRYDSDLTGSVFSIDTPPPYVSDSMIATTRPELLPACVAMYFHPGDERYSQLAGTFARVPIFGHEVPIKADESVDPEFGTGLMMVCTFGDVEDVAKWRRDSLDLRLVLRPDGRFDESAGPLAGRNIDDARRRTLDLLTGSGELLDSTSVRQVVGVHERCSTPVEFQIRPQWFVRIMEHRDRFRARAAELEWAPESMKRRLDDWIDGLKWDWNITRQRHYGVPFPVWYRRDERGEPIQDDVLLPERSALPVDPSTDLPPGFTEDRRGKPGGFAADPDVMDTWMTSSLSPQINDGWAVSESGADPALAPMSLRVQAFEIIRTWLFYTLVQSEFHFGRVPWKTVMISGWGLNEQGKKISKRDLEKSPSQDGFNRYVPDQIIARYGADALRLWATSARLGNDLRYSEKDVKVGRKFTVKIWNVGRFLDLHLVGFDQFSATPIPVADRTVVDRWMLAHLAESVVEATEAFDQYDFMQAHKTASRFFWSVFCDRYLEMVKDRFLDPDKHSDIERSERHRSDGGHARRRPGRCALRSGCTPVAASLG